MRNECKTQEKDLKGKQRSQKGKARWREEGQTAQRKCRKDKRTKQKKTKNKSGVVFSYSIFFFFSKHQYVKHFLFLSALFIFANIFFHSIYCAFCCPASYVSCEQIQRKKLPTLWRKWRWAIKEMKYFFWYVSLSILRYSAWRHLSLSR